MVLEQNSSNFFLTAINHENCSSHVYPMIFPHSCNLQLFRGVGGGGGLFLLFTMTTIYINLLWEGGTKPSFSIKTIVIMTLVLHTFYTLYCINMVYSSKDRSLSLSVCVCARSNLIIKKCCIGV